MMAWLPVFFMYFNEQLEIRHVIYLESLYYISVVILEVPSGMFSDRLGRRITLILSSLFFMVAYLIFGFTEPALANFTIAQIMLAGGMSFMSGTNTSFYYESLQDDGLSHTFGDREAKVQSYKHYGGAFAVLLGGFLGALNLKYAYIASLFFIIPAVIITFLFKEPSIEEIEKKSLNPLNQIKESLSYLKIKELRWIFYFSIISYILSHIPYEFYQPYLKLLEMENLSFGLHAAIYSGVIYAITRVLGAYAAGNSVKWANRFGLYKICAFALVLQLVVIGSLSLFLNSFLIIILLFRGFSMSMTRAPLNAEIAPRVNKTHRASYFSIQSLFSRLLFSLSLIILSIPITKGVINDWPTLSLILRFAFIAGTVLSIWSMFLGSGNLFKKSSTS